jgi:hypothetical protein
MFNQYSGTTTTQLCPLDPSCPSGTPLPIDGSEILRVTTDHVENGVFQSFLPLGQGPAYVNASIWIYLVGPAGIPQQVRIASGAGNNFNTVYDAYEVTPNQWVKLNWNNSQVNSPVNEIIIYTTNLSPPTGSAAGGTFYLDAGSITASMPEPGTVFGAAGGLLGLAIAAIRRKRKA